MTDLNFGNNSNIAYERAIAGGGCPDSPPATAVASVSFLLVDMGNGVMRAGAPYVMTHADALVKAAMDGYAHIKALTPEMRDIAFAVLKVLGVADHDRMRDAPIEAYGRVISDRAVDVVAWVLE